MWQHCIEQSMGSTFLTGSEDSKDILTIKYFLISVYIDFFKTSSYLTFNKLQYSVGTMYLCALENKIFMWLALCNGLKPNPPYR